MPGWTAESNGNMRLVWGSPDDFLQYLNNTVVPAGLTYGWRIVVEPIPKEEPRVDRI